MDQPIGFCIVGCGNIARFHVRALATLPEANLISLVGRSEHGPRQLAAELALSDVSIHSDLAQALEDPRVNAVIICTPSGNHLEHAVQVAAANRHVVVEKPLEITPSRCDEIIRACDQAGVKLCTIFPSRFADANQVLKAAVQTGRFGRLVFAETTCKWWRSQEYYDSGQWRGTWQFDGGGALMNQAVHNVDLLLWLMGPAALVTGCTATLAHTRIEVEDVAVATLRFANGALGSIVASTGIHPGFDKTIGLYGDRGSAIVEHERIVTWDFVESSADDAEIRLKHGSMSSRLSGAADPMAISHENHARQLRDFVAAIREDRAPAVDGHEGRKSVALICALYESAKTGRSITLS